MQSPMAASSGKRKKSTVDKYFAPRNTQGAQPSMRSVIAGKEAIWRVDMAIERFFYDACIPTNAVNSFHFKPMLNAISPFGPGYKGPNYHQLWVNLLKDAKKEVQLLVTLIIQFGQKLDNVKDANNLFLLFDEVIEWVGQLNVVHIVIDNATNYVVVGD
ncbi:hypothetical protein CK203_042524 [Vitis vinifera]|uniref:DUF659 domain-containing protein n=1 Tax=Vitis vinifera TaxID=29760 RepID=A0A438HEU6_VITVI|nr:hypothetical protein CK203_042524 [Vitis vinifera]